MKMKDSGIAWIGEIPEEWELSKIGAVYEERNQKVSDADFPPLSVTKQGVVPQLETAAKTIDGENRKLICKNDFVINSRSDRRGSCGISEYDGSCSLINTVLKPKRNMCNAYYSFVFRSERFADEFYRWGNGIVDDLWSTKWSNMKRIYIPAPSLQEQHRIADYLNRKCSQIDAIIARQQEVIEKLKAYKLSVITEAVTKGLNPHAPMKDSGVEWIGEIPEQWKVAKLKFVASFYNGDRSSKYPSGTDIVDEGVIFVTSNNLGNTFLDTTISTKYITKEKYDDLGGAKIRINDIIFCLRGSVGKCSINKSENEGTIASSLVVIRAKKILADYLIFALQCPGITAVSTLNAIGIGSLNLSADDISEIFIPIPPEKEAAEIAEFLYKRIGKIDHVINEKNNYVNHFVMYKKSLIYEVVTGKKEV